MAQAAQPQIHQYNIPGNLESTVELGCIAFGEAQARYNPVDLFKATKACIDAKRWDDAARLNLLAMTFGRFDMARVADKTAHQAITVAQMTYFGDVGDADRKVFGEHAKPLMDDPALHAEFCAALARIGPPTYYPRYMVQHGMGAVFAHGGDGLVSPFDAMATWHDLLINARKCAA